jgi:hypothetical protein
MWVVLVFVSFSFVYFGNVFFGGLCCFVFDYIVLFCVSFFLCRFLVSVSRELGEVYVCLVFVDFCFVGRCWI